MQIIASVTQENTVVDLAQEAGYWYLTQPPGISSEKVIDPNGVWKFKADLEDKGEVDNWYEPDFDNSGWTR